MVFPVAALSDPLPALEPPRSRKAAAIFQLFDIMLNFGRVWVTVAFWRFYGRKRFFLRVSSSAGEGNHYFMQ